MTRIIDTRTGRDVIIGEKFVTPIALYSPPRDADGHIDKSVPVSQWDAPTKYDDWYVIHEILKKGEAREDIEPVKEGVFDRLDELGYQYEIALMESFSGGTAPPFQRMYLFPLMVSIDHPKFPRERVLFVQS